MTIDEAKAALERWVKTGDTPDPFLATCLLNDLAAAILRAEPSGLPFLDNIVRHILWELPGECWGSLEKVGRWADAHLSVRTGANASTPDGTAAVERDRAFLQQNGGLG